jgi:hypothetical protein
LDIQRQSNIHQNGEHLEGSPASRHRVADITFCNNLAF